MKKIENAVDVGYYRESREVGEDQVGPYLKENIYKKDIDSIIKSRNKDGWELVNTNVHPLGSVDSRFFLFWEREIISK